MIDKPFSVDCEMNVDEPISLSIRLLTGGIRAVWGFTPNMTMPGDPAPGDVRKGLQMTAVRFADGRPLSAENLAFEFIPETTRLRANCTVQGPGYSADDTLNDARFVAVDEYPAYASAEVTVANLVKLGANSDPNPFVIDGSAAIVDGVSETVNNARLVCVPPVIVEAVADGLTRTFTMSWTAVPGRRYRIERTAMPNVSWMIIGTVTAVEAEISHSDTDLPADQRVLLYRIADIGPGS